MIRVMVKGCIEEGLSEHNILKWICFLFLLQNFGGNILGLCCGVLAKAQGKGRGRGGYLGTVVCGGGQSSLSGHRNSSQIFSMIKSDCAYTPLSPSCDSVFSEVTQNSLIF